MAQREVKNVCVVLPASGSGNRMCISTPKQYCTVLNKPLLLFSVEAFHKVSMVKQIIVTVDSSYREFVSELMSEHRFDKVTVVTGGATRHRSIYAGIRAIPNVCPPPDVVLIHDAVRPLADIEIIQQVSEAASFYGAAGVTRPLVSTVISVDKDGFLRESLYRSQYRASEMPQAFRYQLIKTAYEKSTDHDFDYGTECLHLVQVYTGSKVKLVEGADSLWKVTHKKDLYAADGILKEKLIRAVVVGCKDTELTNQLQCHLAKNFIQVTFADTCTEMPSNVTDIINIQTLSGDNSCEESSSRVSEMLPHLKSATNSPVLLTPVLILVNIYADGVDLYKHQTVLQKQLRATCAGDQENVATCAVVTKTSSDKKKLCDLLKVIIRERGGALSGQVMLT